MRQKIAFSRAALASAVSLFALAVSAPAMAQGSQEPVSVRIEAQSLSKSLLELNQQTGIIVIANQGLLAGRAAPAINGQMTPEAALGMLLEGSGLQFEAMSDGAYAISSQAEEVGDAATFRLAPVDTPADGVLGSGLGETDRRLDKVTITGTNIRGIAPDSSPAKVFTREDLDVAGVATAQDFIQTLPQNFGGGSNPGIADGLPNDNGGGANSGGFGSYGSSVNLRGVGSGGTLVLLNGRRIAPSSVLGDFADISMIPASAIERVETLTDGASSIYGSDAVAGVVNFILRDDFDGVEASLRYGTASEGAAPNQVRASVTGGRKWQGGNALGVFEYFDQDFLAVEDRDFALKTFVPSYILPAQRRNSFVGSVSQEITPALEVFADATWSERKAQQVRTELTMRTFQYDATSEASNLSAGAAWRLGNDWFADLGAGFSEVDTRNTGSIDSIGDRRSKSSMGSLDAKLSGPLFGLPAGGVKIAVGGHFRHEELSVTDLINDRQERGASRDVSAVFGEAFIPVVSPENGLPGIQRLEVNLSARYSDYSDFGSTANPKAGILFSPVEGLNLRSSYSTSFQAPPLGRVGATDRGASLLSTSFVFPIFGLTPADPSLSNVVLLTTSGTDRNLDAETSRAFTAGLDFEKAWGDQSVSFSTSWFDISFKDRIDNIPIPGNVIHFDAINIAFNNPDALPAGSYTFNPTTEEISTLIAGLDSFIANPFGLNLADTFFISRVLVNTNTARTEVRGLDLDLSYSKDLDSGLLVLGFDATYLANYRQQATAATPVVEFVDTLFNPVDLKLRARAAYAGENLSANVFVNYVDDYNVDSTPASRRMDDWTTVDVSLAWDTKDSFGKGLASDTVLRLSVTNLLGQDPPRSPLFSSLDVDGYDPTNASPLGRFISLEVTKRF
jgi:iron complex outermembrane recepter protein